MKAVYVTSWERAAGKTMLCAGIAAKLKNRGVKVGYLKPTVAIPGSNPTPNEDARFINEALALGKSAEALSPIASGAEVKKACEQAGKDVVLVEGWSGLEFGGEASKATYEVAKVLDAKVIIIMRYLSDSPWTRIIPAAKNFGKNMLGVVVNQVPASKVESVRNEAKAALDKEDLKLLGVLPEDRMLMGISMAELIANIDSTVVCCENSLGKLVENVMVGAYVTDSGMDYFNRRKNKVVVTRGDRADMQIAALNTSTAGLILTGGIVPAPKVVQLAKEKAVPVVRTAQNTLATIELIEEAIVQARCRQLPKQEKAAGLLTKNFDLEALLGVVGTKS